MALYTIVCTFRKQQYVHQVEEEAVVPALRKWARDLDCSAIPDFGPLSKTRLNKELAELAFLGPDECKGLVNTWTWGSLVSNFDFLVVIVQTEPV